MSTTITIAIFTAILAIATWMRYEMNRAKPEPAKVVEHEPTVSCISEYAIDDILIIEETGEIIISYLPEFTY